MYKRQKIDIITWSEDPVELIASVLSPAKVETVILAEDGEKSAMVVVPDYQLSLAIGKEGQNVRLAARVSGWKIDIKSHTQYEAIEEAGEDLSEEIVEIDDDDSSEELRETDEQPKEEPAADDAEGEDVPVSEEEENSEE